MSERLTELFTRHLQGHLTGTEQKELAGLVLEPALQDRLQLLVNDAWEITGDNEDISDKKADDMLQRIFQPRIHEIPVIEVATEWRVGWKRWVAAASILLILGIGIWLFWPSKQTIETFAITPPTDVEAPKTARALITLTDGRKIYLDSAVNGTLALQDNIKLVKMANGQIAYEHESGKVISEIKYNTLENPRGSKVMDMTLSDGSRIWLNAGSSLTYPIAFTGDERKVIITGEAYFEVTHNTRKPFKLSNAEMEVTVLGTHFNVNAYDDETDIKVTLIEGSVRVTMQANEKLLQPGEQALVSSNIKLNSDVDLEEVMAWKNGKFRFGEKTSIGVIMRQIARWYDVDVVYEGTVTKHFWGSTSRDAKVSEVLKVLEATGGVKFKVEGKRITVRSL